MYYITATLLFKDKSTYADVIEELFTVNYKLVVKYADSQLRVSLLGIFI